MSTFAFIPVTMVGRQKFNTKVHLHRSTYQFARTLERSIIYKNLWAICEHKLRKFSCAVCATVWRWNKALINLLQLHYTCASRCSPSKRQTYSGLLKELLLTIRSIIDEVYIFQHDSLPVHRVVKQWSCFVVRNPNSPVSTCGRPTARTSNRLITWWCRNKSTTRRYRTWQGCGRGWCNVGWVL